MTSGHGSPKAMQEARDWLAGFYAAAAMADAGCVASRNSLTPSTWGDVEGAVM